MSYLLGVDTGGTYTDAVLMSDEEQVVAAAKSLTTRHDLALGIGGAVRDVLAQSGIQAHEIALVSMSTTLATNALVQGQGDRTCLVFIGFSPRDIARQGLDKALQGDPVISLAGGHSHSGVQVTEFDGAALRLALEGMQDTVSGFAIAAQFGTRNPEHELAARAIIREITGAPVTCSHELSAQLGGPKRAMTALLNARLIGMIAGLIEATQSLLDELEIAAPLMVVRGDGALISADLARERPIETILSGPAASIVGARWLTDEKDALVSDIGGTTTDVALLRDGRPTIDPDGAMVGGLRTMVEAVAMRTTGLGGDSAVNLLQGGLVLGPHRVLPISLCAMDWPELVHKSLDKALLAERVGEFDGRFVVPFAGAVQGLSSRQTEILARLAGRACEMAALLKNRLDQATLEQLVARGAVIVSDITPSDASHVLDRLNAWDRLAAEKALELFSRRRSSGSLRLATDGRRLAQMVVDQLTEQTSQTLLEAAFAEDSFDFAIPVSELARHVLTTKGLDHHRNVVALDAGLNLPVIGLGASAHNYYGSVGKRLKCRVILPKYAGVANAIGAVVGHISMRLKGHVTSVGEGRFRVHFVKGPQDFDDQEAALLALEMALGEAVRQSAIESGAQEIQLRFERDISSAKVDSRQVFVEAEVLAIATGRPRIS